MIKNVYAIRDSVANNFAPPFVMDSDALATRAFRNLSSNQNSDVALNPSDFMLYKVGQYDTEAGTLIPVAPVVVSTLSKMED